MKIVNRTNWSTRSIWKLLTTALKIDEKIEGKFKERKDLEVLIVYSNKRYWGAPEHRFSGHAYYYGSWMKIRVPREKIDSRLFARTFWHELYHCRGFRHNQMQSIGGRFLDMKNLEKDDWALEYSIVPKKEKSRPKVDLQLKRYECVLETLKIKTSQLKKLQKQIKKWSQKRKYYESALASNGKIKKEVKR